MKQITSICGVHAVPDADCQMCRTDITELIPNYHTLVEQAEKAGRHECTKCEFVYYKTVDMCPSCGHERIDC